MIVKSCTAKRNYLPVGIKCKLVSTNLIYVYLYKDNNFHYANVCSKNNDIF